MALKTKEQTTQPANPIALTMTPDELAKIQNIQQIAEAEARIADAAVPESKKLYILQEVKIDQFCTARRRVLLTPSMCRHRGCGFDAAKEVGFRNGWDEVPHDQELNAAGATLGDRILDLLNTHIATSHALDNSHIMTEAQVQKQKQWTGVPGKFLTNPALG